jgi:hypothetical protein
MWERHVGNDVIEFPMTVNSVEIPELGWSGSGERAVRLGHAGEILNTLASKPFEAMAVARLSGVFDPPICGRRVDLDSRRDGDFEVSAIERQLAKRQLSNS